MSNELATINFDGLVKLEQLPVITEQLRQIKDIVEAKCAEINSLDVSEDTVKDVKKTRAELNKVFTAFEGGRKSVKEALLKPYEEFESVYNECVRTPMATAQTALGAKISYVETELKAQKETHIIAYYKEYAESVNVDFVPYEKMCLKVGLSDTEKKLKEQVAAFLDKVAEEISTISGMFDSAEIMAEYRQSLNMAQAISVVSARKKAIEEEKKRAEARAAAEAAAKAIETKVEEKLTAPSAVPTEAPKPAETIPELYAATFKVTGTMEQLVELKKYLNERGIKYEC